MSDPNTPQDWQKLWQDKVQFETPYAQPKPPGQVPYGFGGYEMRYPFAGWWLRVLAALVDGFVILVLEGIAFGATYAISFNADNSLVAAGVIGLVTSIWMQWRNGSTGQTPGKRVMHIRVVREETGEVLGGPMGLLRGLVGWAISALTCGLAGLIDVLWPIFDEKKRTLHDMVVGSVVISRQS